MSNITITQFAATLKHIEADLVARMKQDEIMHHTNPARPYQEFIRRGYFVVTELAGRVIEVTLTGKGQIWLARRYPTGFALKAAQ